MSYLCWNCRGMGNPRSVQALRHWSATLSPHIVFLAETMISKEHVRVTKMEISIDFSLVSCSKNHICWDVVKKGVAPWRFVGFMVWPDSSNKYRTWELIRNLCEESIKPILLGGDYNEILVYEEKEGGADRERREMGCFREVMDECGIGDLGFKGQWFTWERGNTLELRVRERLDRFLASPSWISLHPQYVGSKKFLEFISW
ncbi:hypothetical protein POM88_018986 [Heracleum sosnowskyi]|uniref:Endonuclease/exonuclease/phosphatase domain-containing protein n=1 Tax=Heracleum sosnowskyi TaxID=360622 RepID=A0AAD8ITK6_9APIA|nr:hypothetical protein POM88_018986 [Heracleum sosnowskyi]